MEIVDREGLAALNMRRLGAELNVKAMAVYKHFPNKGAILDGIAAAVLVGMDEPPSEDDWRQDFRATFLNLRALLAEHPNALPLVASRPLASPQLKKRLESTRDLLLQSGIPEKRALRLLHAGMSLTVGYLWLEAGGFVGDLPDDAPFLRRPAAAAGHRTAEPSRDAEPAWSRDEDYAAGLDLLLLEPAWR